MGESMDVWGLEGSVTAHVDEERTLVKPRHPPYPHMALLATVLVYTQSLGSASWYDTSTIHLGAGLDSPHGVDWPASWEGGL